MSRVSGAGTARLRLALALMVGGAVALLMPSLFSATVDAPSAVVLTAVALAMAAVGLNGRRVSTLVSGELALPLHPADEAVSFLAGGVTDPVHHPLRPRAPGLA